MRKYLFLYIFLFSFSFVYSQNKLKKDSNAIMNMCGCFEVSFNFSETIKLNNREDYTPSDDYQTAPVYELAIPIKKNKNEISIQHILQVGDENFRSIVKHWRQDWIYQNKDLYLYDKDNNWTYKNLSRSDVKGQWTQKVFQVDDSPRYEGSSSWIHVDGKSFWENETPAPLPRREFSKRKDYNVLIRNNRHEITDYGWFHGQNNEKVDKINNTERESLAFEVGYNYYKSHTEITLFSDQSRIPTQFDNIIVDGAMLQMYLFKDNAQSAQIIASIFEQGIKQMQSQLINQYDSIRDRRVFQGMNTDFFTSA